MTTPAPWRFDPRGWVISDTRPEGRRTDDEELKYYGGFVIAETVTKADGPLLAASPDLLKALKLLLRQTNNIEVLGEWAAEERNFNNSKKLRAQVDAAIAEAKDAIARAEELA